MIYTNEVPVLKTQERSAVTLGKFDGLHRGHQKLIACMKQKKKENCTTVVFTFDVSPLVKLYHKPAKTLLTNEERQELAENLGVDVLIACPFTDAVMNMEAEEFVKEFLVKRLHVSYLAVGPDFRFGHERKGNPELLKQMGTQYDFTVEVVEKLTDGTREISSTYVREELEEGHIEKVNALLGYQYFTRGEIVHGRQLGRTIGVPTANLIPPVSKKFPPNGVYLTRSKIGEKEYDGISNVGYKPTVKENFLGVETYLFNCNEDLYGQEAEVRFYHYLRPERKFASLIELKGQLDIDVAKGKQFFADLHEKL